jgi:hypothetical protein
MNDCKCISLVLTLISYSGTLYLHFSGIHKKLCELCESINCRKCKRCKLSIVRQFSAEPSNALARTGGVPIIMPVWKTEVSFSIERTTKKRFGSTLS